MFPGSAKAIHNSWIDSCNNDFGYADCSGYEANASAACAVSGGSFASSYIPQMCEGIACVSGFYLYTCWIDDIVPTCATNPTMDGCSCTKSNACNTTSGSYSGGACTAPEPAACTCSNGSPGPYPSCPVCTPDSSCSASTCSGSTCYDACGNSYSGSMFCGGCVADSSCRASTCSGSTCSDSCGNTYGGTMFCGGCVADPSCAASTCTGSTCSDSCGNTYAGTQGCTVTSLKICENSCSSGLKRDGSSFSMATGSTRNLVACWNAATDCSIGSGNITTSGSWSEGGGSAISLSGSNPRTVTANASGSESVSVTYSGQTRTTTVSVSCVPSVTCSTAPEGLNHCPADTYTVGDGCGTTLTCNGRRQCDFNWKEVAP